MEIKNITDINKYKPITKEEAEKTFYNAKEVYLKVANNQMIVSSIKRDIFFPFSETENGKFFIETEYDENSLIVTQFKNIRRFFQEELGINCKVCEKVTIEEIKGKTVYGTLPFAYTSFCESLRVIVCNIKEKSVDDLTYEEFKKRVVALKEYHIQAETIQEFNQAAQRVKQGVKKSYGKQASKKNV